ncbi:growth factor receptor-bound protein 10 isoform X2 [Cryptotermes secundus]|nr:growth factor receptor-bound protein 10 isoform X2 [Cryptotermes secundus]
MDICGLHILQHFGDGGSYNKMKCSCSGYERLLELASVCPDEDAPREKEELMFHNDDGSCQLVVVERNLRASDLCHLLALKNRVAKDASWTIVEQWVDLGLERSLEDHEEVLAVYHDMETNGKHTDKRFIFRKDFCKYEFFHSPQQFFPTDMVDPSACDQVLEPNALQVLVTSADECPVIGSQMWVREANKQVWSKVFMLLRDATLYVSHKVQVVSKLLRKMPNKVGDASDLQVLARLSDCNVYTALNARSQFRAPTEFGLCLAGGREALRCLACESERARTCWLTAMRLAKYGKQLRENYRAFKNKQQMDSITCSVPSESVRSRVAMDFTGSVGRIVEDPQEAKAIAVAEGYSWKRRWRPSTRGPSLLRVSAGGLKAGIHITQPWFHSGMTRDQATQLISRRGSVDGVFLVRESRSSPGSFVLTFKCSGKVLHSQIQPVLDPLRDSVCYSLDSGVTKFYDLLQLVEFYQLNAGCLPTRLTHYVVQNPTGPLYAEKQIIPASF